MPNNNELQGLLNLLSQRLGTQPEKLKQGAQSGNLSEILGNMNPNDAAKLQKVLNDQEAAKKLLSSPQAQQLIQKLSGGK